MRCAQIYTVSFVCTTPFSFARALYSDRGKMEVLREILRIPQSFLDGRANPPHAEHSIYIIIIRLLFLCQWFLTALPLLQLVLAWYRCGCVFVLRSHKCILSIKGIQLFAVIFGTDVDDIVSPSTRCKYRSCR